MGSVDWQAFAVPQSRLLNPYVPGKSIDSLLREKGVSSVLKLASNENPYGPPPKAVEEIHRIAGQVHLYPDGNGSSLKEALAKKHGVTCEHILLGNGSNEVLELLIRCFAGEEDEVIYSQRAFIVYALAAVAAGAKGVPVPEPDGFTHDLQSMSRAVGPSTKLICIANPNNPTGTLHSLEDLQQFLDSLPRKLIILLDEAYFEYVQEDLGDSLKELEHPGLVVCRTFSKAYGLAGCRVGYALGDPGIIEVTNRFREPFNVNSIALVAAEAALRDEDWVRDKVCQCLHQRRRIEDFLERRNCLARKSYGNFVLLSHIRAKDLLQHMEDCGIIPRPLEPYGMPNILRITVGRPSDNDRLLDKLDSLLMELDHEC